MKDKLTNTIKEIINLLDICELDLQVAWLNERLEVIEREEIGTEIFQAKLKELKNIIAGMGSFSDLSLIPKATSGITKADAEKKQWELADDLDAAITELLIK